MEELLKNQILSDLYKIRCEKFEEEYIEKYGESEEIINCRKQQDLLIEVIKKKIKEENDYKEIISLLRDLEDASIRETLFWSEQYYKKGFLEGVSLIKNDGIRENIEIIIYQNMEYILDRIEDIKYKNLKENKQYKKILDDISKLEDKYPRVKDFLWDEKLVELTNEEMKAILEMFQLYSTRAMYEGQEMFRIGLREGKIL